MSGQLLEDFVFKHLATVKPNPMKNKNPGLWKLYQSILVESPSCFSVTSDWQTSIDGRSYFTLRYAKGYCSADFRVYGTVEGSRVVAHTIDILHSTVETYRSAVDFRRD